MRGVDAPVRSLQGSLTVRNTLVAAADLRAQWLGGPVEVVIRPEGDNASTLTRDGHCDRRAAQVVPAVGGQGQRLDAVAPCNRVLQRCWQQRPQVRACASNRICAAWASRCPSRSARARARSDPSRSRWKLTVTMLCSRAAGSATCARSYASHAPAIAGRWIAAVFVPMATHPRCRVIAACASKAPSSASCWTIGSRCEAKVIRALPAATARRCRIFCRPPTCVSARSSSAGYRWSDVRGVLQATTAGWRVDVDGPGAAGQVLIPEQFTRLAGAARHARSAGVGKGGVERRWRRRGHARSARDSESAGACRRAARRHSLARHIRPAGDARAAGDPLRQRLDPRRLGARRRAGGVARSRRKASALRSRRRLRATTSPRRCAH